MATSAAFVNQRLLSCKLLLNHYQQAVEAEQLPLSSLEDCYGIAVQLQLLRVYQTYLRELADQYKIAIPPSQGLVLAAELQQVMADQGNQSIEIAECADLEQQAPWLQNIVAAAQHMSFMGGAVVKQQISRSEIAVQQLATDNPLALSFCLSCYQQLNEVIDRHRELYMEY